MPSRRRVDIQKKDKEEFWKSKSAFLKDTTDVYDISFQTEKSIKIKIEVDTNPPLHFTTEQKLLIEPRSFMTRCFTLPNLFAGKMRISLSSMEKPGKRTRLVWFRMVHPK